MTSSSNRKNTLILFFSLIVVMLGFGIVIPIMPFYIDRFGAGGRALGALMAIYAVMQLIFAPFGVSYQIATAANPFCSLACWAMRRPW